MRSSPDVVRLAAAAIALAGAGHAAADLSLDGGATFGYARQDSVTSGQSSGSDSYDFALSLSLAGVPFRPGLLAWGASGAYSQFRSVYGGTTSGRDALGYNLSLALLDGSPIGLNLAAGQTRSEFTQGASTVGSTLASSEYAGLVLAFPNVPHFAARFSHVETTTHRSGLDDLVSGTYQLHTTATDHVGPLHYSVDYGTAWNSGTLVENNYRNHSVSLGGQASLPDTQVSFGASYLLRVPTVESPLNPRFDDDTLSGSVRWQSGDRLYPGVAYSYQRALISAPDTPAREGTSHALSQSLEYRYRPNLRFTQSFSAAYTDQRVGTDRAQVASESLGGGVSWFVPVFPAAQSQYTLTLGAGASTGFLQGDGVVHATGYGVTGGASLLKASDSGTLQASYSISWADSLAAGGGSRFAHEIRLESATTVSAGLNLRLTLAGQSARQTSELLGTSASRSISGIALATWGRYHGSLAAGLSEGLSAGMRDLGLADGLIWAPAYDTHSQFVTASGGTSLGRLALTGVVNWTHSQGLGAADSEELGLSASLGYTLGLFTIGVSDAYSTGRNGDFTRSGNLFMVRLSRSFGWHF